MRVVSLVILLAIIGGLAFVFIHEPTRNWVFKRSKDAAHLAEGYSYAKTPREAVDSFIKAVKARNFSAAARYCSEDYAKVLDRLHGPASDTATRLDRIAGILHEKGYRTPMSASILWGMDPFPETFKLKPDSVKEIKKGELAEVVFEYDPRPATAEGLELSPSDGKKIDPKLFMVFPLVPENLMAPHVEIKMDKKNDAWKIEFIPKKDQCDYFIDNYKRYLPSYDEYLDEMRREAKTRTVAATDLLNTIVKSR
jgi:hypothetical protein